MTVVAEASGFPIPASFSLAAMTCIIFPGDCVHIIKVPLTVFD